MSQYLVKHNTFSVTCRGTETRYYVNGGRYL